MVEGGRTPLVDARRLDGWGYRLVIFPNSLTRTFARQGLALLHELRERGSTASALDRMMSFVEFNRFLEDDPDQLSPEDGSRREEAL
jgi:2-methylisocitrate lyase-like PEP mutase family enzyme